MKTDADGKSSSGHLKVPFGGVTSDPSSEEVRQNLAAMNKLTACFQSVSDAFDAPHQSSSLTFRCEDIAAGTRVWMSKS